MTSTYGTLLPGFFALCLLTAGLSAPPLEAKLAGDSVAFGSATVSQQASVTTIKQTTASAIIDWKSFSLGAKEKIVFDQPSSSSVTLVRVTGGNPALIAGSLQANGQVYLIDANGLTLGRSAKVAAGGFVANTLDVSNQDFICQGTMHFTGSSRSSVVNFGAIDVSGDKLDLMGSAVDNEGRLHAEHGSVTLAGGTDVWVKVSGDQRAYVQPHSSTGRVENGLAATITATRAELTAAGGDDQACAIENAGLIQATSANQSGGEIVLTANTNSITNSGIISASATGAGRNGGTVSVKSEGAQFTQTAAGQILAANGFSGQGGTIETSGQHVSLAGTVSAGSGGSWLVDPVDLTIDSNAAATIDSALNTGTNVTEQTTATGSSGYGTVNPSGNGDIIVAAPLAWSSAAKLTLTAYRNITVNSMIKPTKGSLALTYGSGGTLGFAAGDSVIYSTTNESTQTLSINGKPFTLIYALPTLISDVTSGPTGNYALAVSLSSSGNYAHQVVPANLTGTLEGLGNQISGVSIVDTTGGSNGDGLISTVGSGGLIRNLTLTSFVLSSANAPYVLGAFTSDNSGTIQSCTASGTLGLNVGGSSVGGIAGVNESSGTVIGCISSQTINVGNSGFYVGCIVGDNKGTVNGCGTTSGSSVTAGEYIAGVVGFNEGGAIVENTVEAGTVTATNYEVGGLIGFNMGTAENCSASGNVSNQSQDAGGLIGLNYGTVENCSASGNASSTGGFVGGLIGGSSGMVSGCHSTGSVNGSVSGVGGLIGGIGLANGTTGQVTDCYATGAVTAGTGTYWVGGLIGHSHQNATISFCEATGLVKAAGGYDIGGLVGSNDTGASVNSCYATGNVSTTGNCYDVGGLAGFNSTVYNEPNPPVVTAAPSSITASFAVGSVTGAQAVGGLVGYNDSSCTVQNAYAYGPVNGTTNVGGLAGVNNGQITTTYSTGMITGTSDVGGLIGDNLGSIANSYWLQEHNFNFGLFGLGNSASNYGATPEVYDSLRQRQTYGAAWGFPNSPNWTYLRGTNDALPYLSWQTSFYPPASH